MRLLVLVVFLAGCAAPQFTKPGAGQQEFAMDSGQCQAQALSSPLGAPRQAIYNACMQGKGWSQ